MLAIVVVAAVSGVVSTAASIWTKHKLEKKTDQQTAHLVAKVDSLSKRLDS